MRSYARFVVSHAKVVLVACALLMVVFVGLGSQVFTALVAGGFDDPGSPAQRADAVLERDFGGARDLVVMLTAPDGVDVGDGAVTDVAAAVVAALGEDPGVGAVTSYTDVPAPALRSQDGRSALVVAAVTGDGPQTVERVRDAVEGERQGVRVDVGGAEATGQDIGEQVLVDLARAEAVAVPLTLVLLLVVFGSVVAAGLPLATGAFAVFGAFGAVFVVTLVTDVSIFSINLITGLGLGLAIDAGLLLVSRFREEVAGRREPADVEAALVTTMCTAGRTVLFTGLVVSASLCALLVFPIPFLRSFGYGGVAVVAVSTLAALTLLPALLAVLGPRVDVGRVRRGRPVRAASERSPAWARIGTTMHGRPWLAVPAVLVLLAMAWPLTHASFGSPDDRVLATDASSRVVGDALRDRFPPGDDQAPYVLVDGGDAADVQRFVRSASRLPGVETATTWSGTFTGGSAAAAPPLDPSTLRAGDVSLVHLTGPGDGASKAARDLVRDLRALPAPAGAEVLVGGYPATLVDNRAALVHRLPLALGIIGLVTFGLLLLFTRSLLVPLKALALNALTLGAVLGAMTWVFQDGHLSGLLGFTPGPLDTSMPILLFCIAFGLSMDYELFLVARMKEARDHGAGLQEAVVEGLSRTARITTTAAGVLAITFAAFGTSRVSFIQLFGLGTALAIVLDATVVRALLVPAFMRIAGPANWWAPRWLGGRPVVHERTPRRRHRDPR